MSFAVVLEGMTLIAYVVILAGGKQKRESGWRVLSGLHVCCAALQCAGMAIIVSHLNLIGSRRLLEVAIGRSASGMDKRS